MILSSNFIYNPKTAILSSYKPDGGGASSYNIFDYKNRSALNIPDYDHSLSAWLDSINDGIANLSKPVIGVVNSNGLLELQLPDQEAKIIVAMYNGIVLSPIKPDYIKNGTTVTIINSDIVNSWDSNDIFEVTYMI